MGVRRIRFFVLERKLGGGCGLFRRGLAWREAVDCGGEGWIWARRGLWGESWAWCAAVVCVGEVGLGARLWFVGARVGLGACLWIVSTRVGLGGGCGLHRRGWLGARL